MNKIHKPGKQSAFWRTCQIIGSMLLLAFLFSGCVGTPAMLNPAADGAAKVSNLTNTILIIAAIVFTIVEALLIYTAVRYSRQRSTGIPKQTSGNVPLEVAWTLFPAVVLAVVFALTLSTLFSLDVPPASAANANNPTGTVHVRVIGHQWWWEFQYPDLKITTANELHVPANSTVVLDLESADVIHSFWVPEIGGKIDAIPGHINHTWYKPGKPGRYDGQCSEFCGAQHALMRMQIVVDTPDQFAAWVKQQTTPIPQLTGDAALGESMFMNAPCAGCHTIDGTKAVGTVGPNLTHFASRQRFAGGSFDNIPANVIQWIQHPREMKPGTPMPDLGEMSGMAESITNFLESLK